MRPGATVALDLLFLAHGRLLRSKRGGCIHLCCRWYSTGRSVGSGTDWEPNLSTYRISAPGTSIYRGFSLHEPPAAFTYRECLPPASCRYSGSPPVEPQLQLVEHEAPLWINKPPFFESDSDWAIICWIPMVLLVFI